MNEKVVAGYCRTAWPEPLSIERQKREIERFVKARGLVVSQFYVDDGESRLTLNRPAFQRLMRDCENGKIHAVFVPDALRIAREKYLVHTTANTLRRLGVELHIMGQRTI